MMKDAKTERLFINNNDLLERCKATIEVRFT